MTAADVFTELRRPDGLARLQHSASQLGFYEKLRQLRIPSTAIGSSLTVSSGCSLHLSTDPGTRSALAPRLVQTADLDEYKSWIGCPDEAAGDELGEVPRLWSSRPPQQAELERAAQIYLFGDSRRVARYRELLARCLGPFSAAVYAARQITIQPGASLIVTGSPAILLVEALVIRHTGRLVAHTALNATFGRLEKIQPPATAIN